MDTHQFVGKVEPKELTLGAGESGTVRVDLTVSGNSSGLTAHGFSPKTNPERKSGPEIFVEEVKLVVNSRRCTKIREGQQDGRYRA
jgi:hypothetical protein